MPLHLFEDNDFLTNTLNAIPFPILVVDDDVRILFWNSAAFRFLGNKQVFRQKSGEVLLCIHSTETSEGCGHSPSCKTCIVRNSVTEAIHGHHVYRKKSVMELQSGGTTTQMLLLVTASPFEYQKRSLSLLLLEDIHELMQLGSILPICSNCKKIRTSDNKWEQVEGYIKEHIVDVDFTHGLCPDCIKIVYPDYVSKKQK